MSVLLTLLWVLVAIAITLLVLIALALVSWLRFDGQLDGNLDDPAGWLRVRWTLLAVALDVRERRLEVRLVRWRVVQRRLGEERTGSPEPNEPDRAPEQRRPRQGRPGGGIADLRFYLRQLRFAIARIELDQLDLDLRVATPDPAVTGMLYGATCGAVYPLLAVWPSARLAVSPDFVGSVPAGRVALAVRVRLATLVLVAWRVLWFERSKAGRAPKPSTGKGRRSDGTT